jgi:hypothetical protein
MTDYTKLIERLYNSHDAETLCADAALVIEALSVERDALQAENERLKRELEISKLDVKEWHSQADALQAKLDALTAANAVSAEPAPKQAEPAMYIRKDHWAKAQRAGFLCHVTPSLDGLNADGYVAVTPTSPEKL